MELEELQATWTRMSQELEKQKKLTNEIILQMTQQRFNNKFNKLWRYETAGGFICYLAAFYIIVHFDKLNTWYLQLSGAFSLVFLILLPILVLNALRNIQRIDVANGSYGDTLVKFTKAKNRLLLWQRMGIYGSFLFVLTSLPVFSMIMKGKDIFLNYKVWLWYLPTMMIFLFLFSRWAYGYYKGITNSAESILKEL